MHGRRTRKLAPVKAATRSSILQGGNITAGMKTIKRNVIILIKGRGRGEHSKLYHKRL